MKIWNNSDWNVTARWEQMKSKTISVGIKALIFALILLSLGIILSVSVQSFQITDSEGNPLNYAIKGETLTILVSSGGEPVT